MSVSVCLYVLCCLSVRKHISGTARPIFIKFPVLFIAYGRGSAFLYAGVATRYILPVLSIRCHVCT